MKHLRFLTIFLFALSVSVFPSISTSAPVTPAPAVSVHMALGNPSNATPSLANEDNFLMVKPLFVISYNKSKGGPNWVSWHIDSSELGTFARPGSPFFSDTALPAAWRITKNDYHFAETGMDRGHMCPSADRSHSVANMKATFVMSNMLPQSANLNRHVWASLEDYGRRLVNDQGKEVYIIAGGVGSKGMIKGKVNIPTATWKIIVVIDAGENDLSRINKNTRVIAVKMPNNLDLESSTPWPTFMTTVDKIEEETGYDFLSNLPTSIQKVIEAKEDTIGDQ